MKVYLDAWKYVKSLMSQNDTCAVSSFVSNWTSPEFEKFVDDLAELVDELGIQPGSDGWKRGEDIWTRIIELEEAFWPNEGEESD